jgi:glycosyltransferase involved in cell wall biosynthesis
MRIAIATVNVPFIVGGSEYLVRGLERELVAAGHEVDVVAQPFRFAPRAEVLRAMDVWRTEDLTALPCVPDRVICLKFPAYGLRHPNKALWLTHQHREAYDLSGRPPGDGEGAAPERESFRASIKQFDDEMLGAFHERYTIGRRVSERLAAYNGLASSVLWPPPPETEGFYCAPAEDFVFFPSRLEGLKRQSLLIEAMRRVTTPVCALLAGEGGLRVQLERDIAAGGLADRVRLLGRVSSAQLRSLYAMSLAVFFAPFDEDYGYVTIEAMLSSKPVITCNDAGGPLEFVVHGETGLVVAPDPAEIALAIDTLWRDKERAREMGQAGRQRYDGLGLDWQSVVERLV